MHVCIVLVLDTYRIEKRVVGSRERMSSKSCFGFEAFFFFMKDTSSSWELKKVLEICRTHPPGLCLLLARCNGKIPRRRVAREKITRKC